MAITSVRKDPEALTMTITTELDANLERAWQLWADPRQLERWWGPPTYPATFVDHDLAAGGRVTYFMTGPEGDKAAGWWTVVSADPPHRLEFKDGFADESGAPNDAMPTMTMVVTLTESNGGGTSWPSRRSSHPWRRWSSSYRWAWTKEWPAPWARSTGS
jgi:uncharacterized protein YndB with AHSA1/START domain